MTTRLDRIVEFSRTPVTRDAFGSEVVSWSEIDKVWANVKQTGARLRTSRTTQTATWRSAIRPSASVGGTTFRRPPVWSTMASCGTLEAYARGRPYRRELELYCQTDVHHEEIAFTPVVDAGRILWGANTLVTWGGDTEIIWRGI